MLVADIVHERWDFSSNTCVNARVQYVADCYVDIGEVMKSHVGQFYLQ